MSCYFTNYMRKKANNLPFAHFFTAGGTKQAVAQNELGKQVPIFKPQIVTTHRYSKIHLRELG